MRPYAKRFDWTQANPLEITALLDEFAAHPEFLTYPTAPDVARASFAGMLVDPANVIWATYSSREFTGIVFLTKVVPRVNALLHFFFLDKDLAGKRKLLQNIIGHCFTDLGFHRLTMEVPDKVLCVNLKGRGAAPVAVGTKLERFARRTLGFRFEGEPRDRNPELPESLSNDWVARQGSRIEQSYFDGEKWFDVIRLRLLASEWVGTGEGGAECLGKSYCPSPDKSSAPLSEAEAPVTAKPPSPRTSSPSDSPT